MNVDISMISTTVSLYILGLAAGQLIGGPLSDKHGRLPIMVLGLSIFALASLLLTTSTYISTLWLWRVIQAIGGGIAIVGVPATIRDNADGKEAAKLFSLVALIMMVAPSLAPSVGTFILSHHHWHWIFYSIAGVSAVAIIMAIKFIPYQPSKVTPLNQAKGIRFIDVFKHKQAVGYMVAQSFAFAVMVTFITNSAMVYMGNFKVSADTFSLLFALNIVGLVVINRMNNFLLNRFESAILLRFWLSVQVCGGLLLVTSASYFPQNLALMVGAFIITISAIGGITSNSTACFLKYFGKDAGTASAVLGVLQCVIAATVSAVAAFLSEGKILPVVILMFVSSGIALLAVIYSNKQAHLALQKENIGTEITVYYWLIKPENKQKKCKIIPSIKRR